MLIRLHASDLEQLLRLLEEENQNQNTKRYRIRLEEKIANMHLNIPKKILKEFIKISEILVTPPRVNVGKMIVVTGLDKSGKETQALNPERNPRITSIYDYLLSKSYRVMKVLLPSYRNTFGALIASYLGKEGSQFQIIGELSEDMAWILWSLDRAQHNPEVERWLSTGLFDVVVSKRWTESNIAYHKAKGVDEKRILMFERNIIKPTYTFIIDISPELALQRMRVSKEKPDKYETIEFLREVRKNYLNLHQYYPYGKIFYFDGSGSLEEVNKKLLQKLDELGF
jgi:thymidylate kinase